MRTLEDSSAFGVADLRAEFGVTARTLRHYEERGLLSPRRQGQRRLYSATDRVRLRLTLRGRRIGMSLAECLEIIDLYGAPAGGRKKQARVLLERIKTRERALRRQRRDIDATLAELARVRGLLDGKSEEAAP